MATSTPIELVQDRLKLSDPDLALLCVPAEYIDCRFPVTRFSDADDTGEESSLFSLRLTGNARAFDGRKNPILDEEGHVIETLAALQAAPADAWKYTKRLEIEVMDSTGRAASFNEFAPWGWRKRDLTNPAIGFTGTMKRFGRNLYLQPDVLTPPPEAIGGIWTRYLGIQGRLNGENVTEAVKSLLDKEVAYLKAERAIISSVQKDEAAILAMAQEDLAGMPGARRFGSIREVIRTLHLPETIEEGERAMQLARRISVAGIRATARSQSMRAAHPKAPLIVPDDQVLALAATQPETLTDDQRAATLQIAKALRSPVPMNGLLSGDVGTGKTLPFLLAAAVAHNNGATVGIIAPTFILANQIADQLALRFGDHIRGVERVSTGKKVKNPGHILVGSAGLVTSCEKSGVKLDFLILDEQHKMSVATRTALVSPSTHVLEASATPIPRSLATVFFDGMQVMNIRQAPVKRDIRTRVVDAGGRGEVSRAIRETVAAGRRVLVVYPRLETKDIAVKDTAAKELKSAKPGQQQPLRAPAGPTPAAPKETTRSAEGVLAAAETFEKSFPGKVAVLHGLQKDDEKTAVIEQVKSLEKQVLVASVVVETGIDIPDIGLLLIRDADYLGISQLHQLRGRLARKGGAADCFLMVESLDRLEQETLERLYSVRSTTDGYLLAELDLRQRGFGSYVDDTQIGSTQGVFRLLNFDPGELVDGNDSSDKPEQKAGRAEAAVDISRADKALRRVRAEIDEMQRVRAGGAPTPVATSAARPGPAMPASSGFTPPRPPPGAAVTPRNPPTQAPASAPGAGSNAPRAAGFGFGVATPAARPVPPAPSMPAIRPEPVAQTAPAAAVAAVGQAGERRGFGIPERPRVAPPAAAPAPIENARAFPGGFGAPRQAAPVRQAEEADQGAFDFDEASVAGRPRG